MNYNYLQASRDESATVDETLARADAQALYDVMWRHIMSSF